MTTTPILSAPVTPPAISPVLPSTSSPPSSTTPTGTSGSSGSDALGNASSDTFLKLLVAQLQYQDPMNPADSTQFLAQTAQFTEVEKLSSMDTTLTNDLATRQNALATSLIGDQVTMGGGPNGADVTGVVTGMRLSADGPILTVDGQQLNLNQLQSVQGPASNATSPSGATAASGSTAATGPTTTGSTTSTPPTSATTAA